VFRRPSLWETAPNPAGKFSLWGPGVDTQAIIDAEIQAAAGTLDFWFFDRYPTASELLPDVSRISEIDIAFEHYMTSAFKSQLKFALLLQTAWLSFPGTTWNHLVAQANGVAALVADPQYLKIKTLAHPEGLPLIGLGFESSGMDIGHWTTFLSIVGPVYLVIVDGNTTAAATLSANAVCNYGPRLMPAGNGQHAWSEQSALNQAAWTPSSSRDAFPNAIVLQDRRVFMGTSTPWVDQPTQPQLVNEVSGAVNKNTATGALVHAWDEIAESGPGITPGVQELTRYLDAVKWVRNYLLRPDTYSYQVACHWKVCVQSGTFTYIQPLPGGTSGIVGNWNSEEITSVTTGDYVEFSHPRWKTVVFYTVTGPDRGICEVRVNGVFVTNVDLYSAVQMAHVAVWTFNFADPDSPNNTVRILVTGTKNVASSSVKIGYNTFGVTYNPHC
jgi:hypothetical protein